jgi:hypothetical protein
LSSSIHLRTGLRINSHFLLSDRLTARGRIINDLPSYVAAARPLSCSLLPAQIFFDNVTHAVGSGFNSYGYIIVPQKDRRTAYRTGASAAKVRGPG